MMSELLARKERDRQRKRAHDRKRADTARRRREALVLSLSQDWHRVMTEAARATGAAAPRPLVHGLGRCANCTRDLSPQELEVDHMDGRLWEMHRVARWTRVERMWAEYMEGVRLRALCRNCNAADGGGRRYRGRR